MDTITVKKNCPLCSETANNPYRFETRDVGGQQVKLGLNKCMICGLQFISPRLSPDALSRLYDTEYHSKTVSGAYNVDETVSLYEYQIFKSYLLKFLPQEGRILDVGCGVGNMLMQLKNDTRYTTSGVEISKDAAERAQQNGLNVLNGNLFDANFEDESFDAVFLLYVLEHVDNPLEVLKEIKRILKKNGLLFLAVPNYRYLRIAFDNIAAKLIIHKSATLHPEEHLQNFTPVTLKKMLNKAGFQIRKQNCARPLHIGSPAISFLKKTMYIIVKGLSLLGYNIGGIHVIARKQ